MSVLQLKVVSPQLLRSRDLSLAVPGTYRVDGSCVKIHKFLPDVEVGFMTCSSVYEVNIYVHVGHCLAFW